MAKASRDEYLRHEKQTGDEESFLGKESQVVRLPPLGKNGKPKVDNRGRRGLEDMMASFSNDLEMSVYALERIASAEDMIAKVLALCSPEALALILEKRPVLRRYAPDTDE
jgi:hypothetical protein